MKLERILWIAFIFPPYGGTEGLRMGKYLQHILADDKTAADVLTIVPCNKFPQYDPSLMDGLNTRNLNINRVNPGFFHRLRYRWGFTDGGKGGFSATLAKLLVFLSNTLWVAPAILRLIQIRLSHGKDYYNGIYTFVDPFASLVVGAFAKLLFNGKWVVEYGDPWRIKPATLKRTALVRIVGAAIERRFLKLTNKIITRNRRCLPEVPRNYIQKFR